MADDDVQRFSGEAQSFTFLTSGRRRVQSLLSPTFWRCWFQQGRPRDYPVAVVAPEIIAAGVREPDGSITVDGAATSIRGGVWDTALCRAGILSGKALAWRALELFPVLITLPNGAMVTAPPGSAVDLDAEA